MFEVHDMIGLTGVGLILISYLLLQIQRIESQDLVYSLMNLAGAAFILISLSSEWNLSSFVVELFWLLISAYGVLTWIRNRRRPSRHGIGE